MAFKSFAENSRSWLWVIVVVLFIAAVAVKGIPFVSKKLHEPKVAKLEKPSLRVTGRVEIPPLPTPTPIPADFTVTPGRPATIVLSEQPQIVRVKPEKDTDVAWRLSWRDSPTDAGVFLTSLATGEEKYAPLLPLDKKLVIPTFQREWKTFTASGKGTVEVCAFNRGLED